MVNGSVESIAKDNIRKIIKKLKSSDRVNLSEENQLRLIETLNNSENILISFSNKNPLSVMETITVALCILNSSDIEISEILGVSKNTIKSYMGRIREKLNVEKKSDAIIKSLRIGILRIVY